MNKTTEPRSRLVCRLRHPSYQTMRNLVFDEMTDREETDGLPPPPPLLLPFLVRVYPSILQSLCWFPSQHLYFRAMVNFVSLGQDARINTKPVSGPSKCNNSIYHYIAVAAIELMFVGKRAQTSTSWLRGRDTVTY